MTTVHVDIRKPQACTTDRLPVAGSLDVSLYRRQVEGGHVVVVTKFAQVLVDGQATLELTPTDGTNAWVVNECVRDGKTRVVAVPDAVGTVEYTALPDLDLATLTTSVAAEAAWAAIAADVATIKANGTGATGAAGGFLSGAYPNPGVNTTAFDQAVAARIGAPTSQTAAALAATSVTLWKASTAYKQGQAVLSPAGAVVTALADFTSGSSYDATKWSTPPSSGGASGIALDTDGVPYYSPGGSTAIALDTDGVPYLAA